MGLISVPDWDLAVVETIEQARRNHTCINVGDLLDALRRTQAGAYDRPSVSHAERLAKGLRSVLTIEELIGLCEIVKGDLERSSECTVRNLKKAVSKAAELLSAREKHTARIATLAPEATYSYEGVIHLAVILQALGWAIQPPEPPVDISVP